MLKTLDKLVGETIVILAPQFDPTLYYRVKLHAVENGGIWIESQDFTTQILSHFKATIAPKTLVFFLPFSQISHILGAIDVPAVSERAIS